MKKSLFAFVLIASMIMMFCFSACGNSAPALSSAAAPEAEEPLPEGAAYGYAGDDPVELAIYKYMVEEVSADYDKADVCVPTVSVVAVDYTNKDDVLAYGDFWIDNYAIEDDTLKDVSGGNYAGVMHLAPEDDGYVVSSFDMVEDGSGFDESAKELFGEHYDAFMAVYSDSDAREELRRITVSDYVNMNGLAVTKFQDEGWDPVELYTE